MKKKKETPEQVEMPRDDALFEQLGKNKKKRKRRIIITVASVATVLAVVAVVGIGALQSKVRQQFASSSGEVLSYEVKTGTISTVVSGSGSLADMELTAITVPEGVTITDVSVKANETVKKGDLLARVDMASVMSAMADLQTEIKSLDKQISAAEDDAATNKITAGVSGRVKMLYGTSGADVSDVMYENGALALISLDGYMAVDLQTDALKAGDSVTVVLSGGKQIKGAVSAVTGGIATVLVTDNGTAYDEEVAVKDAGGQQVGTGKLYIHSPLRVTGYAGTVKTVHVKKEQKVSASTKLFTLKDTGYSANYNALLRTRGEKEEILLELLTIKREGAVLAPFDGSIQSVDYEEEGTAIATLSADEKMSVTISVDESDILSLQLGQEVTVTVSSVSEDSFAGTLTEIDRTSASSGTYSAVVELEKTEGMLSGMTADVSVKIEGVENAILIPIDAVHKTSDGAYVYTGYNEALQEYGGKVNVVTGLENSTYVEIKSGLNVGDTVYYTESKSFSGGFGNRGEFGGMGGFGGGEMPDFGGGNQRPGGSQRPSGSQGGRG